MARNFEEFGEFVGRRHNIGNGALGSCFEPKVDGGFCLYTETRLHNLINHTSSQQNPFLSIQDAAQAA